MALTLLLNMIVTLAISAYLWFAYLSVKNGKDGVFQYNFKGTDLKVDVNIDDLNLNTILALAVIMSIITACVWLLVIASRSRIQLAIEVVRDACKAVFAMPVTVAFPIITFLLQIIVFAFCIAIIAFLSTAGEGYLLFYNEEHNLTNTNFGLG